VQTFFFQERSNWCANFKDQKSKVTVENTLLYADGRIIRRHRTTFITR